MKTMFKQNIIAVSKCVVVVALFFVFLYFFGLKSLKTLFTSRSDQDSNVETVFSIKVHNYPDLLNTMNRKNYLDDIRHSQH